MPMDPSPALRAGCLSQAAALAVAACNAGTLGSLPCAMLSPEAMDRELTALAAGTGRPFRRGVSSRPARPL